MYLALAFLVVLGGCASGKAIYIEGEKDAKVVIEVSMTGGRVSLDGPFRYCSEPALTGGEAGAPIPDSICAALMGAEEKPESSD